MAKKRFSINERMSFHSKRLYNPSAFACEADSGKVAYSDGFVTGFQHRNKNSSYWKAKGKSHIFGIGYIRGASARKKFKS